MNNLNENVNDDGLTLSGLFKIILCMVVCVIVGSAILLNKGPLVWFLEGMTRIYNNTFEVLF